MSRYVDPTLFESPPDECKGIGAYACGLPASAHVGWQYGGPSHAFQEPKPRPRKDRIAASEIVTSWTCTWCGESNEVSGVADLEWMECDSCRKESYVVH